MFLYFLWYKYIPKGVSHWPYFDNWTTSRPHQAQLSDLFNTLLLLASKLSGCILGALAQTSWAPLDPVDPLAEALWGYPLGWTLPLHAPSQETFMVCTCTSESTPRTQPQGLALVQGERGGDLGKAQGASPSQNPALPLPVLQSKTLHGSTLNTSVGPWAMHKHP